MSTTARSTPRGGKNNKVEATSTPKTQKTDTKTESPKVNTQDKSQVPTAEQMRMAEIMDTKKDDLALKDKIKQVMEATQKTEDEVCTALHDCDNDPNRAVYYLLEGSHEQSEWSTSVVKKKKNRTASTNKSEAAVNNHVGGSGEEDWDQPQGEGSGGVRGRPRQRGSGPPRLRGRGQDNRGWRGRENKENERNLEDSYSSERGRRGGRMANGPGRGGRGGRGGSRMSRTFQSRDKSGPGFPRSIETWNNPSTENGGGEKMENWDNGATEDWDAEEYKAKPDENWGDGFPSPEDWDNEEYTGSLSDTKVFTASSGPEPGTQPPPDEPEPVEDKLPMAELQHTTAPLGLDIQATVRPVQMPPSPVSGTLTPAQTQYLNQLAQSSESYKNSLASASSFAQQPQASQPQQYPQQYPPAPASGAYSSSYGVNTNSFNSLPEVTPPTTQALPARTKPLKPRVPPPSKIPSSAVEMPPGDALAAALLDVQFGGLEFGSDSNSLDTSTSLETSNTTTSVPSSAPTPTPPAPTPTSVSASVASLMESYATSVANSQQQQNSLANTLAQSQKVESMLQSEVAVTSSYATTRPAANSVLTELTNSTAKTDSALAYNSTDYSTPQAYQKPPTAASYPTPASTYNSSSYSTSQVTSSSTGYSSQTTGYTNSSGGYGSSNSVSQSTPSVNSYPSNNTYTGSQTSYAYTSYPASNYQSSGQTYPPQSYQSTGTTYPYQNSSYPPSATQQSHKMNTALSSSQGKESQYESGQVSSNSIPTVSTVSSTPSLGLSATSQSIASTKVTALSTATKSGIVAGIPPQVPQMIANTQYIMSQATGFPYLQQPMFSYDDALMLQQRIAAPPMPTQYFDMSFQQQPTSLGTARDASLGNVAYSMSDGRFARADNNASPVPSTLSQQNVTQGHQQPVLNPTGFPPGYAYAVYSGFPTNFQYGAPTALYPMAPTAAASNSSSGQYKGPGYASAAGYSSGYEASADGYKVGSAAGYTGTPQTKASGTPTTSTDLTQNMYSKGHATLNKVNSYEKAGFHSGTPPPFNLTGSQSGLAPSTYAAHPLFIPTMPPHQQHTATLLQHQPLHQIEMRNHGRRMDGSSNSGPRSQATSQPNKSGSKQQNYSPSFWANSS